MTQPYITLTEATQAFTVSKRTIERKIKDGEIGRDQIRMTEHEDGASEWGADLRRTTRAALGLLCREHEGN